MKKFFVATLMMLVLMSCTAFAASSNSSKMAVLIIGGAEFKTPDYYKLVTKAVKSELKTDCIVGDEVQSKYQRYLFENDALDNAKPRKNDLVSFSSRSGYSQVLFLVIDSTLDMQNNAQSRQKNRISLQLDAYLMKGANFVNSATTNKDANSKTSALRARRSAFEDALKEVLRSISGKK